MYQNDLSIENAQGENLLSEVYKRIIDAMLAHIDDMPDSDKKLMMNLLIEKLRYIQRSRRMVVGQNLYSSRFRSILTGSS